jgi:hypothetical protein
MYVNLVGIELEGAWFGIRPNMHHDGSVDILDAVEFESGMRQGYCRECEDDDCGCEDTIIDNNTLISGEISSPPLALSHVDAWIDSNKPAVVNNTCGLHVHVSLTNDEDYVRLTSRSFEMFFKDWIKTWAEENLKPDHIFWNRFNGNNRYCYDIFRPEEQMYLKSKEESRYSHLNFCYGLHRTIECRLFPAFKDPKYIKSAVHTYINCINAYLDIHREVFKLKEEFQTSLLFDEETEELLQGVS